MRCPEIESFLRKYVDIACAWQARAELEKMVEKAYNNGFNDTRKRRSYESKLS